MSRYFSEAMNDHPEFQRLKQRIRDLEKENKELLEHKEFMRQEYENVHKVANNYMEQNIQNHKNWCEAQENIKLFKDQIAYFNSLSPFQKAFYHFID